MPIRPTRYVVAVLALQLLSPTLAAAQDHSAVDMEAKQAAIEAAHLRFYRAEHSGSVDSVAAAVWADAVILAPGKELVRGHDLIRQLYQEGGEPPPGTTQRGPVISVGGDMAVQWGLGRTRRAGPDGGPIFNYFKFVSVVEKRGGEWKLLLNNWNSRPAPAPSQTDDEESELAVAQNIPSAKAEAELEAVVAANRRFGRAERSRSLDSIAAAVWDDGVMLPPGRRWQLTGPEEIFALMTPGFRPDSAKAYTPGRRNVISAGGHMAVRWGPGSWVEQASDGPIRHYFKAVTILEERGGEWKVLLHSWNSRRGPEAGADGDPDQE